MRTRLSYYGYNYEGLGRCLSPQMSVCSRGSEEKETKQRRKTAYGYKSAAMQWYLAPYLPAKPLISFWAVVDIFSDKGNWGRGGPSYRHRKHERSSAFLLASSLDKGKSGERFLSRLPLQPCSPMKTNLKRNSEGRREVRRIELDFRGG